MANSNLSNREFNQDTDKTKQAEENQPNIVDLLSMPERADIDFEEPRLTVRLVKAADLG